ncbi:MAG: hypothetical protein ACFFCW_31105 [Candidatus Hodarchaeota archaeon]
MPLLTRHSPFLSIFYLINGIGPRRKLSTPFETVSLELITMAKSTR